MLDSKLLFRLTDYVVAVHEARNFEQATEVVRAGLDDLIPADCMQVGLTAASKPPASVLGFWPNTLVKFFERCEPFHVEDPFHVGRLRLTVDSATPLHHLIDQRTLVKTQLYNEAWRPHRFRHLMRAANPGKYPLGFLLARTNDTAFNADEVCTLDVLAGHMNSAVSKMISRHQGKLPTVKQNLSVEMHSWLVCDCTGAIIRSTPDSIEHLHACLGPRASITQVPPSWHCIYLSRMAGGGPEPREYRVCERNITAHVAPIKGSPNEFTVFFVERVREADPLDGFIKLGLTNREAEVMKWMIEGKTNPEIGIIMGITPLTAKKHVENIRIKLNAPNRTAAVALVMEKLQA